jgi:GNAT superfamily N-acetyltransferase
MRRELTGECEIDDDRTRVDAHVVFAFLRDEAYWVPGRDRGTIERLIRESTRVLGIYDADGAQIAFARVMSDGANMAWLGDVFVLPQFRGRGLGTELIREAVGYPEHRDCLWYLNTRDAKDLYRRFGFQEATERTMVRPRPA